MARLLPKIISAAFFQLALSIGYAQININWKFKTNAPIIGSPILDNGDVYFGGLDSNFYALDAENGKQLWYTKTGGDIRSTPLIESDNIYFISGDGLLYCVDEKGKVKWTFATKGEKKYELFSFADYFQSSPVYENNTIYFGSGDSCIYAVNARTGKLDWKYKTGGIVHTRPCFYAQNLFIGSFDGWFYCLDKNDGRLVWKFKSVGQQYFPKGEFNGSATAYNGAVFVGARDFNFYALNADKGYCYWNMRFPRGWAITTPLIKDSVLYIGAGDDQVFLAVNPANGNTLWKFNARYNVFGAPVINDSIIYFGTMMGHLFGLQKKDGKLLFDFTTDGYKSNRNLYFKDDDTYRDDIFSKIKRNEDFLDLYIAMGAIISQPAVYKNSIICTSMDGTVYSIKID